LQNLSFTLNVVVFYKKEFQHKLLVYKKLSTIDNVVWFTPSRFSKTAKMPAKETC